MFHSFNSYMHWFITKVINNLKNDFNKQIVPPTPYIETTDSENNNITKPVMILPIILLFAMKLLARLSIFK